VYQLEELPVRDWTLGLPVYGDGTLRVSKSLVGIDDWSKVKGHAIFNCDGCTLGNGRTPMHIEGLGDADFTSITFDEVDARADFADGHMHLVSSWRSDALELDARVDATLAKTVADSQVDGCVIFRPTEDLLERDPKMYALISTTGAERDEAGWFMIKLSGPFGSMKRQAQTCHP
jgi:hypothetical protein